MIPLRLRLHNFMAYRTMEAPLEFEGIHVACLAGPNGAGKSALLDAMTWALWGQARARSDDDLVTLGEFEMSVEFEFALGEGHYRVIRKRTRPGIRKTGQSLLEFQVAAAGSASAEFVPLTGNTMRDTQRAIEGVVRLDYQTFINSALLLQGRADEFTLKAPGDRKRVLGEVLGLSRYDELEARAREQSRVREGALATMRGQLSTLLAVADLLTTREERVNALEAGRTTLLAAHERQAAAVRGLEAAQRTIAEMRARRDEAAAHVMVTQHDIAELEGRRKTLTERVQRHAALLQRAEAIEQAAAAYQAAAARAQQFNDALQQLNRLQQDLHTAESHLQRARHDLESLSAQTATTVAALRELSGGLAALEQARDGATAALDAARRRAEDAAAARVAAGPIEREIGALEHQNLEIVRQGKEINAKIAQLSQPGAPGLCPLCGTELGPHGHQQVIAEYQGELTAQRQRYRENDRRLKRLRAELDQLMRAATSGEQQAAQEQTAAAGRLKVAEDGIARATAARDALPKAEHDLAAVRARLDSGAFAPEASAAVTAAKAAIAALAYDQPAHRAVQEELRRLSAAPGEAVALEEVRRQHPLDEKDRLDTIAALDRRTQRLAEERAALAALDRQLAATPDTEARLAEQRAVLAHLNLQVQENDQALGLARGEVAASREAAAQARQRREQAAAAEWEKQVYDDLALAFGRRGLQAMLIETALPELEEEANRLLTRLTDNGLSLRLATQRQGRGGATIETLDIIIADETGGSRPYELYSGGEAFRINFALRVALSKLLARRSGAPLQTLIIDEGFGTQDTAGREKLVEAIGAIAGEFERVLVITHIDELKDAFPVRIEVSKGPGGSQVQVYRL